MPAPLLTAPQPGAPYPFPERMETGAVGPLGATPCESGVLVGLTSSSLWLPSQLSVISLFKATRCVLNL